MSREERQHMVDAFTGSVAVAPSRKVRLASLDFPPGRSGGLEESMAVTVTLTDTPRHFPLAQEIIKGMTKSAVLASFGPPEATVTGADLGQLRERLLYLDALTTRKTLIFFVDGDVIRAETYTQ